VRGEAEMWCIGKLSHDRRGAGSIIGAVFIVLIIMSGYTFYTLNVNVTEDYTETVQDMQELDLKRNKENSEFTSVTTTNDDNLNITIENTGSYQAHFIWLGIFNETSTPPTQQYVELDVHVDPAETATNIPEENITIPEGQERVIQLVTELGNTFSYSYPEESSEEGGDETYDYVDNTSNEDSSDDKGTHSLFSAQKAGPDGIVDTLTEGYVAGENVENDVDGNGSNEDGSADKGTETDFTNATGTSLDSNYMNIQEADTGGGSDSLWLYVNTCDWSVDEWNAYGFPFEEVLNAIDYYDPVNFGWIETVSKNNFEGDFFFTDSGKSTETIISVTVQIYARNSDSDNLEVYMWDGSSYPLLGSQGLTPSWGWVNYTATTVLDTWAKIDGAKMYVESLTNGGPYQVDCARLNVDYTDPANYELDFEYQWDTAFYSSDNEEVCIYVGTHTGSESLNVSYWSGSWTSLGTITSTGWNNFTATGLASATYTIQLIGATESSDSEQDDWDIDLMTLHTWNATGYLLDLEVQWTDADYDETNEWLSIYGGTMEAEDILVDVWNGTAWTNVFTDLSSGWNSVDVSSYLVSSPFTIRFRGGTETGDLTQNSWEIDTTFLYVWS
jgi:hypothetical protein